MRPTVTRIRNTRPAAVLALVLLGATACGSSADADAETPAVSGSPAAATPEPLNTVSDLTADWEGGNAQRAMEQLGSDVDVRLVDVSGADRPVEVPVEWRICTVHTLGGGGRFVYQLGVVRTDEKC